MYSQAVEIWKVLHSLLVRQPSKTIIGLGLPTVPTVGTPNIRLSTVFAPSAYNGDQSTNCGECEEDNYNNDS